MARGRLEIFSRVSGVVMRDGELDEVSIPREVVSFLAINGWKSVSHKVVAGGVQSRLIKIQVVDAFGSEQEFALKEFRRSYGRNNSDLVMREYCALARFQAALDEQVGCEIRAPRPLAVFPSSLSYLMEYVEGRPVRECCFNSAKTLRSAAYRIAGALELYHDTVGEIYGDFHSRNVLRDRKGLVMIDCTPPVDWSKDEWSKGLGDPLVSLDAGYWAYCCVCSLPRALVSSPLTAARDLYLGSKVVAACAIRRGGPAKESLGEIIGVSLFHLLRLLSGSVWAKVNAGIGILGCLVLWGLAVVELRREVYAIAKGMLRVERRKRGDEE